MFLLVTCVHRRSHVSTHLLYVLALIFIGVVVVRAGLGDASTLDALARLVKAVADLVLALRPPG